MENFEEKQEKEAAERLTALKNEVLPSRALLSKIVDDVTKRQSFGYSYERIAKGRTSTREGILSEFTNTFMSWKTWVPIGVVAAVIIVFVVTRLGGTGASGLSMRAIDDEAAALEGFVVDGDLDDDLMLDASVSEELAALSGDSSGAVAATPVAGGAPGAQDPFGFATIQNEASGVGFGSDFDNFFSSEGNVNSALSDL